MTYTEPLLAVFFLFSFIGLYRTRRQQRSCFLPIGVAGLFLSCWPPAQWMFSRPLEAPYYARQPVNGVGAIVVLASSVDYTHEPIPVPDASTYSRCRYASWLYSQTGPVPVIVSGGNRSDPRKPVAATTAEILESEGIAASVILREERSVNTYENALFTAGILRGKGIRTVALVVEADSMLRAELCFRKLGITIIPAAFDRTGLDWTLDTILPGWSALRRNERALHEYGGLLWYKLKHWI